MSNTFNTTATTTDNNYFDLLDYIDSLPCVLVAAQMASSTAWRIDTLIVSGGRQLLKFIKEENFNQGGYQAMSEVLTALEDAEFAEQSFAEIGTSPEAEGTIETLRALNAVRDQWHELAERLVSMTSDYQGQPRVYATPSIDSIFSRDPALRVNETTQRRLKIRSERVAEALGAPDLAEEHFKRSLQRKQDDNKRIANALKEQSGLARFMFELALRQDDSSAAERSKAFYALPLSTQRTLLDNAANAAMRADEQAADDRNLSETEYDIISLSAIKAMTELRKVLTSKRFTQAARVQDAAQI